MSQLSRLPLGSRSSPESRSKPKKAWKAEARDDPDNKSGPDCEVASDSVSASPRGPCDACATLLEALSSVPDPRDPRGVRYPLGSVLALCVLGFMRGCQNMSQVRRFGFRNKGLLKELGFPRPQVPAVSGFSRILGAVSARDLQMALSRWLATAALDRATKAGGIASVDGKASKSSACHIVNVFLHDVEQAIWQAPVDKKANEITAFKQALEPLLATYPFLQLFVGDAMFAGAPLCDLLIDNGRHYLFQVKADQPQLLEKLQIVFAGFLSTEPGPASWEGEKKEGLCGRS